MALSGRVSRRGSPWREERRFGPGGDAEAWLFDLDGVLTDTASVHDAAWKVTFDELLARRAGKGAPYTPSTRWPTTSSSSTANLASTASGTSSPRIST